LKREQKTPIAELGKTKIPNINPLLKAVLKYQENVEEE
jgi:hypothetical protein